MSIKDFLKRFSALSVAFVLLTTTVISTFATSANAESNELAPAQVTFTFDDGFASSYTQAAPTLAKYGLKGTNYVTTGCVGMTTAPNKCRADNDGRFMTWAQIKALQNQYGWEIGSHTVTHPYLASYDRYDGQPQPLTRTQVENELKNSKAALANQGINAESLAFPYGDYNNVTREIAAKYYSSQRGFADTHDNVYPYNDTLLNNMQVQVPVSVAAVKAKIDYSITNKRWLVLTFHDIMPNASSDPDDYEYSTANLAAIAAYVKAKQDAGLIKNVNVTEGLAKGSPNLMPNGTFENGISGGWRTDTPAAFSANTNNNGSFPNALRSVRIVSPSRVANAHLYSPRISVNSSQNYLLKSYLNVQRVGTGEVGFYIDEYDQNGNWVSGQFKAREPSAFVNNVNFVYKPTSVAVKSASLQIYVTGNANLVGFVDNVQWFPVGMPTVAPSNMVSNGTFDAGIADGWSTDDTASIKADNLNNGSPSNPVNSVSMTAMTRNVHLFAPTVSVDGNKTYYLENYVNITRTNGGGIGFYIDEYDVNGNWISGQYKYWTATTGPSDIAFSYQPTSTGVSKAQLQIILEADSGVQAYYDDLRWRPVN